MGSHMNSVLMKTFVYNREYIQQLEKKNREQESVISDYSTMEASFEKTIDQYKAKVSDLNSKVDPGYIESLEKKLKAAEKKVRHLNTSLKDLKCKYLFNFMFFQII